jgi:hypothetical protein
MRIDPDITRREEERLKLQARLDAAKSQTERNRMGQFSTPPALARDILAYAQRLLPEGTPIRFLDPAIGTGAFYAALREIFPARCIERSEGFEIDPHYGESAARLWEDTGLALALADFTRVMPEPRFNLIVCNPPYVRHHHLDNGEKARLHQVTQHASGMRLSGLAGLYCHFLGLAHAWMEEGGLAAWLIPSEFMDVNYGQTVKRYLLRQTTLLHIHRFDPSDVQFADALVSSAVVWFRKSPPPVGHAATFSFGGSLAQPTTVRQVSLEALAAEPKWTRFPVAGIRVQQDQPTIADYFRIKRGLATGDNSFFILPEEELGARDLPRSAFRPILPSPRYVKVDIVDSDEDGTPRLDKRLFLLDLRLPEDEIRRQFPPLWTYLQEGKARGLHERYLCRHRTLWYAQENRPPAPIVCTYLGRSDAKTGRPFRFILNRSIATVPNVYLAMYPTPLLARAVARDPDLIHRVWEALNHITPDRLLGQGRVYGGGLHKLEPKELANVPVPEIAALLPAAVRPSGQREMFASEPATAE